MIPILQFLDSTKNTLTQLGAVRDGLLVVGAMLYGAGYAAWSLHSWVNRLGPAPALEAQYFIAGVPILLLFAATKWLISRLSHLYRSAWPTWYGKQSPKLKVLLVAMIASFEGGGLVYFYHVTEGMSPHRPPTPLTIALIIGVVLVWPLLMVILPQHFRDMAADFSLEAHVYYVQIFVWAMFLIAALLYLRFVYPSIPQALGGALPRVATVDFIQDKLAAETLAELAPPTPTSAERIVRSKPLLVYSASKEAVLVSTKARVPGEPWALIEVKQEAIAALHWSQ